MPVHSKIIFLFLIASRIAVAQGFGGFPGSGGLPSEMPGAAGLTQAPLERYNQLLTPQFKYEKLGENVRILNQIGNGDPTNFYASGQDEAVAYGLLNGNSLPEDMYNPDMGLANQGEYTLFRLVDRCRMEEGCGNIGADGKYFIFGFPTHATNVYPIGRGIIRDSGVYDRSSSVPSGDTVPTTHTHSGWQGRNSIDDGRGFIYGRYLINQASLGNPLEPDGSVSTTILNRLEVRDQTPDGSLHNPTFVKARFVDIPFSNNHLAWGFTSYQICKNQGYGPNSLVNCGNHRSGDTSVVDPQFARHLRMLIKDHAVPALAKEIAAGRFGNVYPQAPSGAEPAFTVEERERRDVVVTILNILKEVSEQIAWEERSVTRRYLDLFLGRDPIDLYTCSSMPRDVLVGYDHEESRFCFKNHIAKDCLAKRSTGSNRDYNTSGNYEAGHCFASYGDWAGSYLFERGYGTARGYQLSDSGDGFIESRQTEDPSAGGYAPYIAAIMAGEMVHAFYERKLGRNRMADWPNSMESLWQSGTAVIAQALVLNMLEKEVYGGFIDQNFQMKKNEFVRSITATVVGDRTRVTGATPGVRYSYPHEPRGYDELFLGPLFMNMETIYRNLLDQNVKLARMQALFHSMAPKMKPPERMCLNGICGEYVQPVVSSGGPLLVEPPVEGTRPVEVNTLNPTRNEERRRMESDDPNPNRGRIQTNVNRSRK